MFDTVDGNALVAALHDKACTSFEKYQMKKAKYEMAWKLACVRLLECQEAKKTWERCSAAAEEASATLAEYNREPRVKEEREGIGGHPQDHVGVAEDLTQEIYAIDDEEKKEKTCTKTKKKCRQEQTPTQIKDAQPGHALHHNAQHQIQSVFQQLQFHQF